MGGGENVRMYSASIMVESTEWFRFPEKLTELESSIRLGDILREGGGEIGRL